LLNCCKISFSESKLRLFVSYVVSLHALKIFKSYPQVLKSSLFRENPKDKLSKSFRNKIDFTSRIKKFLANKISLSEKKYQKICLNTNQKTKLTHSFDLISDYLSKKHKYLKLKKVFGGIIQINPGKFFSVQFQKFKLIKIFSVFFNMIKQEKNRLKCIIYQKWIKSFYFNKLTVKPSLNILQYCFKYLKSVTRNRLNNKHKSITLPTNKPFFSSSQNKVTISQKINFSKIKSYNFLEKLIESLNLFTKRKFDIDLVLHETRSNLHDMSFLDKNEHKFVPYFLNKEYQFIFKEKNQLIKKIISQLRQYKDSIFFEEGIQLVFSSVYRLSSPKLLTRFISSQFKSKKNHYFFFRFIRKVLSLFSLNKLFKIKSIKIVIKGRLNGSKRSKKRSILIGKQMPLMFLSSNIKYSKSTIYGPHGTFGVKT